MAVYQIRIAYLTPVRRTRHYYHHMILAGDRETALDKARQELAHRSPGARIIHEAAILRLDSSEAEAAIRNGWRLEKGWWTRPFRPGDDLATIAAHGHAGQRGINTRSAAACLAIDQHCGDAPLRYA